LSYLAERAIEDPEFTETHNSEAQTVLGLSDDQSRDLRTLIFQDYPYAWNSGGSYGETGWHATSPYRLDEIAESPNPATFVASELARHYDPQLPVWAADRPPYGAAVAEPRQVDRLAFVPNEDLRRQLNVDLVEAEKALEHGLWKSCMVLSGCLVEGLLLDVLGRLPNPQDPARTAPASTAKSSKRTLEQLLDEALGLKLLSSTTVHLGHACRDYRNLVHPRVQLRRKTAVNKLQASTALNAAHEILRELSIRAAGAE
jgi:hypothetical protein